jgi:glycosylphosphatidylinositol transamidase
MKGRRRDYDLYTAGRIIEGIFRSLNNLLERFHQSFFFYLLPSTGRYVSIGMYMPGFGLLAGSMLLLALGLWFECLAEETAQDQDSINNTDNEAEQHVNPISKSPNVVGLAQGWILCHLLGLILVFLPRTASRIGAMVYNLSTDEAVGLGIAAYSIVGAYVVARATRGSTFGPSWKLFKCAALLEIAVLAFSMSLCNFSLAYIVTMIYAPVAMLVTPSSKSLSFSYISKAVMMILAHPLTLVFLACTIDTYRAFPEKSLLGVLMASFSAAKTSVMFSITDGYIYGNYSFVVATVCLTPCWHLLWHIVNARIEKN